VAITVEVAAITRRVANVHTARSAAITIQHWQLFHVAYLVVKSHPSRIRAAAGVKHRLHIRDRLAAENRPIFVNPVE
jgi:hypothetical protein